MAIMSSAKKCAPDRAPATEAFDHGARRLPAAAGTSYGAFCRAAALAWSAGGRA